MHKRQGAEERPKQEQGQRYQRLLKVRLCMLSCFSWCSQTFSAGKGLSLLGRLLGFADATSTPTLVLSFCPLLTGVVRVLQQTCTLYMLQRRSSPSPLGGPVVRVDWCEYWLMES